MSKYSVIAFLFLLAGCVDHPDTATLDIPSIEQSVKSLGIESDDVVIIPLEELPETLKELNPKEVRGTKFFVYIVLHKSFNKESGLFVAPQFGSITRFGGTGSFPEFKRVKNSHTFTFKDT